MSAGDWVMERGKYLRQACTKEQGEGLAHRVREEQIFSYQQVHCLLIVQLSGRVESRKAEAENKDKQTNPVGV